VRDAVGDDARLAGTRAGKNQNRAIGLQHRLALLGIQAGGEIRHVQLRVTGYEYGVGAEVPGVEVESATPILP
jgi:hypothetical protein